MDENEISSRVIGSAIEVHRHLGPGLLETVYRDCLAYELQSCGMTVEKELILPVRYKTLDLGSGFRVDLMVDRRLIVELKAVDAISPVFKAQLLSCLRMSGIRLGLLINFNTVQLRDGIKRVVNNL